MTALAQVALVVGAFLASAAASESDLLSDAATGVVLVAPAAS